MPGNYVQENADPMNVVFFFSGGASSMKAVLESPDHGSLYKVVGAVTNRPREKAERGWGVADDHDIDTVYINPFEFEERRDFYQQVTDVVDEMNPEVVGLSGFLKKHSIIVDPFLTKYENNIWNVHPADLAIYTFFPNNENAIDIGRAGVQKGRMDLGDRPRHLIKRDLDYRYMPAFRGDDAVRMAVLLGEDKVCSTIHVVEKEVDRGKIVVRSPHLDVDTKFVNKYINRNNYEIVMDYGGELQDRMKTECDVSAFLKALELKAKGLLEVKDDLVYYDGKVLPFGGFKM